MQENGRTNALLPISPPAPVGVESAFLCWGLGFRVEGLGFRELFKGTPLDLHLVRVYDIVWVTGSNYGIRNNQINILADTFRSQVRRQDASQNLS